MKYRILKNDSTDINHPITKKPVKLYRILAMKTFESKNGTVHEGTIGGFIQDESNLNQNDSSWVFNTGKVFDNSLLVDSVVTDNAAVFQNAILQDTICRLQAHIYGEATIVNSLVTGNVTVNGKCNIKDSKLYDAVRVGGIAVEIDRSELYDGSRVTDSAKVIRSVLKDTTSVSGISVIDNCHYSGHTIINNAQCLNETRKTDIDLKIEQQVISDMK